jgi:REP element-mobilizing transposase RayT
MKSRDFEGTLPDPIAFFITWATYGTWLPGDERGWVEYRRGWQLPDPLRKLEAAAFMTETSCRLDPDQRRAVEDQIMETCEHRSWTLHAVNCRSNHAHVVLSANLHPKQVRSQIKAWCTRRLKDLERARNPDLMELRENWWAERGSQRWIYDPEGLESATLYVRDGQD